MIIDILKEFQNSSSAEGRSITQPRQIQHGLPALASLEGAWRITEAGTELVLNPALLQYMTVI